LKGEVTLGRIAVLGRNRFVFKALEEELKKEELSFYKRLSSAAYQSSRGNNPVEIIQALVKKARSGCAGAVMDAIKVMRWTEDDFKFASALAKLEEFANTLSEEDRALVLQDSQEWRKHWDYYVRAEPAGSRNITAFLGQITLGTTQQPKEDGLALLTVHSAKGMEFDVVFLIGMTEGTFPDYRARGNALEEESRSAFVAVTRSKRLLYLTYPETRIMPWGDVKRQQPSRYLREICD
jgi:DNA helicase II / ATP-dependent DNA helicase PcrA